MKERLINKAEEFNMIAQAGTKRNWNARVLLFTIPFICSLVIFTSHSASAEQGKGEDVRFSWAFAALQPSGSGERVQPITQDQTLKSGDKVKMLLELNQKCFVYVIHHSPQGEITLLFPYKLDQFTTDYEVRQKYYIPKGNAWFQLDEHPGRESFYLLASDKRLSMLESLLGRYESALPADRTDLSKQILAEIHEIRKRNHELSSPAERPVTIGGTIRGFEKSQGAAEGDLDSLSQDISSAGFYGRTFTIDHQ